jgi:hypothetical protein
MSTVSPLRKKVSPLEYRTYSIGKKSVHGRIKQSSNAVLIHDRSVFKEWSLKTDYTGYNIRGYFI